MRTRQLRLRDDLRVSVVHRDTTPYGSGLTGLIDKVVRRACSSVLSAEQPLSSEAMLAAAPGLLAACFADGALGQLYARPGHLRERCLYPDPEAVTPARLSVHRRGAGPPRALRGPARWSQLAPWIEQWTRLGPPPRSPQARALWDALADADALTDAPDLAIRELPELTFVGHATVAVSFGGSRALFDPFLVPEAGPGYRPLRAAELRPDAVFITHSHPDHYDLSSLLQLGRETRIYVPAVERESLLALDMAARLRALGFNRVYALRPGDHARVGALEVSAHVLLGEQPTDAEVLHPECRNVGLIYVAEFGGRKVALLADAGTDDRGSCLELAAQLRRERGPVDVLLGGFRAWRLCPAQLLESSVARYLLFVPRSQWGRRYKIMNDAEDLLAVARAWGAHVVVPYANGGAPWFWELGLGPRLDGAEPRPGPERAGDFDPDLAVLAAAARRQAASTDGAPAPRVVVLRPGEGLAVPARGREPVPIAALEPRWPFPSPSVPGLTFTPQEIV